MRIGQGFCQNRSLARRGALQLQYIAQLAPRATFGRANRVNGNISNPRDLVLVQSHHIRQYTRCAFVPIQNCHTQFER